MESNKNPYTEPVHEELFHDTPNAPTRTIAVAIDPSSHADHAFKYCLENVAKPGDQIVLLNVRPVPSFPSFGITPYTDVSEWVDKVEEKSRTQSHELLKKYGSKVLQHGLHCRAIALRGDAREELVSKVNELNPAIFVIGSRGLGTFKRTVLGSVSDYAAHHANCAVLPYSLPINEELYDVSKLDKPDRVIAVAVDGSSHSNYAFDFFLENVARPGDRIVLLHVRPLPVFPSQYGIASRPEVTEMAGEFEEIAKKQSHNLLRQYGSEVQRRGLQVRAIGLRGDPREELILKVNEINPSMLVVGARGFGAMRRELLGSVSDFAMYHAKCPVFISKHPQSLE
ncbi:hypothetical protein HK098_007152 [Nowakowskiella sp. JEL0407]|nr:hypothetical protein HK098_007152 [Nowakowskiella sp. JEL0407]